MLVASAGPNRAVSRYRRSPLGPWAWGLNQDRIARPGGVVVGQAMMAMAATMMVLAICEKLGRFATLATISATTNFMRAAVQQDVIGVARAVKVGRSTAFGEVELFVAGGDGP